MKKIILCLLAIAVFSGSSLVVFPLNYAEASHRLKSKVNATRPSQAIGQTFGSVLGDSSPSEDAIISACVKALPKVPSKSVKSSSDEALIFDLVSRMGNNQTFVDSYQYLTSADVACFSRTPNFVSMMDQSGHELFGLIPKKKKLKILGEAKFAKLELEYKQIDTGYPVKDVLIFSKQNGVWKLDFLQSMALELKDRKPTKPVSGNGQADLSLEAVYMDPATPVAGDQNTNVLILVKNNGPKKVSYFNVLLHMNQNEIYAGTAEYSLKKNQSVIVSIPTRKHWLLNGVGARPETHFFQVGAGFNNNTTDPNIENNYLEFEYDFQ